MNRARRLFQRARGGVPGGAKPVNTSPPSFTGLAAVDQTLVAAPGGYTESPTGFLYQHEQSDDGATGWTAIVGATSAALTLDAALEGKFVRPKSKGVNANGSSLTWAVGAAVGPITEAADVPLLAPNALWAAGGGVDDGYDVSTVVKPTPSVPADRVSAMGILRPLFIPWKTFTGDYPIVFGSMAKGGVAKVEYVLNGTSLDVLAPSWRPRTNVNGGTSWEYGYHADIDYAATMAMNAAGSMSLYVTVHPTDPTILPRVMGPYYLYARAAGVGVGKQFDISLEIDPKLSSDTAGVRYRKFKEALSYCSANAKIRPQLLLTRAYDEGDQTTRYQGLPGALAPSGSPGTGGASPVFNDAKTLCTIMTAPGVAVVIGDDTIRSANQNYDAPHFMNADGGTIKIETLRAGVDNGGIFRSAPGGNNICIYEGTEITGGTPTAPGWSGSGSYALKYGNQPNGAPWTFNNTKPTNVFMVDVNMHDVPSYGFVDIALATNCILRDISGSGVEAIKGAVHNCQISRTDGIHPGFREFREAFLLTYTGSATVARFQKTSANGGAGTLNTYEDSDTPSFSMTIVNPSTGPDATVTMVQNVIDYINANWTNWHAGPIGPEVRLSAAYLSMSDLPPSYSIGLPSDLASNTATKRTVPPEGLALKVIADVHANALVWNNTQGSVPNYQNNLVEFNTFYDLLGAGNVTIVEVQDTCVRNNTFQDLSRLYSSPSIPLGSLSPQPSQIGEFNSHMLFYNNTMLGTANSISTSSTGQFDAYCRIDNNFLQSFARTLADADLVPNKIKIRTGNLPSGVTNSEDLNDIPDTSIVLDPASTPPDATPLLPLQWGDGTYAGARAAVATDANQGWNQAA